MTITASDIARQVTESLTDQADDFNVAAIVADIITAHGRVHIDDIDHDTYWTIVSEHAH